MHTQKSFMFFVRCMFLMACPLWNIAHAETDPADGVDAPVGDAPPAPDTTETPQKTAADDAAPAQSPKAPTPAKATPAPDPTPTAPPQQNSAVDAISPDWRLPASIAAGAIGGLAGAAAGAAPMVAFLYTAYDGTANVPMLAYLGLALMPGMAALAAGGLGILFAVTNPGLDDIMDVLSCAGAACLAPLAVAFGVLGGCGMSGCSTSLTACADAPKVLSSKSPATAHAFGAAVGAFVGVGLGGALIVAELQSQRVDTGRIANAVLIGAATGTALAAVGGGIGGAFGARLAEP